MHQFDLLIERAMHSEYRKRVITLAKPIDGLTRTRVEFARFQHRKINEIRGADTGLVFDLQEYLRRCMEFTREIGRHAETDPLFVDMIHAADLPGFNYSKIIEIYHQHGFFIFPQAEGINSGILISSYQFLGLLNFIVALQENCSKNQSGYTLKESTAFIDAASILEEVVFVINVFRFFELEPVSSLLLREKESEESEYRIRELIQRRLGILSIEPGRLNKERLFALIDEIKETEARGHEMLATTKVLAMGFSSLGTAKYFDEDEVQHTLNLLNAKIHSSIIVHSVLTYLIKNTGMDSSNAEAIANLAHIAFGDAYYKLGTIFNQTITGKVNPLFRDYVVQIARLLGHQQGQGQKRAVYLMLSRREDQIKEAARILLEQELMLLAGKKIEEVCNVEEFGKINSTTFITRDQLSLIAGIWRENYQESETTTKGD